MKNKIKKINKIIFLILINLFVTSNLLSNEINFEANSIELIDKDNKIIAKKTLKYLTKMKQYMQMKWIMTNLSKL